MVSSSHSYKTEHSQWYQCLAENSASEIERGGTDNEGDDGGTGYINIRFAKLLHFTWHEFCIEVKFTLRASSFSPFSPKSQSGHIICVCIISMKVQFLLYLTFRNCMTSWVQHCTPVQSTLSGPAQAQRLRWLLTKIHNSLRQVLCAVTHIPAC